MVKLMTKRTDMAVEAIELDYQYDENKIINGLDYKKLTIDEELSKRINKPKGVYYNIDNLEYKSNFDNIVDLTNKVLNELLNDYYNNPQKILFVGLGNMAITPDSLGPLVVNKLEINGFSEDKSKYQVFGICPGVKGCTGMESSDIVKALCDDFHFDLVVVIDALACNHITRMCNSIQFCTFGLSPGAGIGNHRVGFNKEILGVNVLAIGIPTVSDIDCYIEESGYFVTPNHIDEAMDILSYILSSAINKSFIF